MEVKEEYFSPYRLVYGIGEYKIDDASRRPRLGMILEAQSEFDLDVSACVFIEDKVSDTQKGSSDGVGINLPLGKHARLGDTGLAQYHHKSRIFQVKNYLKAC